MYSKYLVTRLFTVCIAVLFSIVVYGQSLGFYNDHEMLSGDTLSYIVESSNPITFKNYPNNGTVSKTYLGSGKYEITYIPDPGFLGQDTCSIEIFEGYPPFWTVDYHNDVFDVKESILNPVIDVLAISQDTPGVVLNVIANDISTAGGLYIKSVALANHLIIDSFNNDSIFFRPVPVFSGTASIQYVVCDSIGHCEKGLVKVVVVDQNQVATEDTLRLFTLENRSLVFLLPPDSLQLVGGSSLGILSNLTDFAFKYMPLQSVSGMDTLWFEGTNNDQVVIIRIIEYPISNTFIVDDYVFTHRNVPVTFNVQTNDVTSSFDIDQFTEPLVGELSYLGDGEFSYVPPAGFEGQINFLYTVCLLGNNCETGTVYLFINNLTPDYSEIATIKNRPVAINYDVPISNFEFSVAVQPVHGFLQHYPGLDTVSIGCETIRGNSLVLYYPDTDFTGEDEFELEYCTDDNGECTTVKIDVSVMDITLDSTCVCVDDCVWPGDANSDGITNMNDLLTLGYYLGHSGEYREDADPGTYYGQYCQNWLFEQLSDVNLKHVDTDGDGVLAAADTIPISAFYNQAHTVINSDKLEPKAPYPVSFRLLTQPPFQIGDLVSLELVVGSEQYPVTGMYGMGYSFLYNSDAIVDSTLQWQYYDNSWLVNDEPYLSMSKLLYEGQLDAGLVSIDDEPQHGHGEVAKCDFIIEDELDGIKDNDGIITIKTELAGSFIDKDGRTFSLENIIVPIDVQIKAEDYEFEPGKLFIFPNPAKDQISMHLNGSNLMTGLIVRDLTGRVVLERQEATTDHLELDVSSLGTGLYILSALTETGPISKKIEIIR